MARSSAAGDAYMVSAMRAEVTREPVDAPAPSAALPAAQSVRKACVVDRSSISCVGDRVEHVASILSGEGEIHNRSRRRRDREPNALGQRDPLPVFRREMSRVYP